MRRVVFAHTKPPAAGILGTPRVSVLDLNLALDRLRDQSESAGTR